MATAESKNRAGSSVRSHLLSRWPWERVCLVVLLVGSLGFYLVNAVHYEGMPLRIEENEWPRMGRGTFEHGIPLLHPKEDPRVHLNENLERVENDASGLWHPPTYMYAMATVMAVVGTDATASLRWIGVAGLLLCCILIFLLGRELFPRHWFRVGAIASALLLVHPYAIQGGLFLDIDTSIYAPTFLLFALLVAKYDRRGIEVWPTVAMAASFALILWVKLPTAFVVIPAAALYWVLRHGLIAGLERSVAVLFGGAFLFLGTYWLYTEISGQSFTYMFDFTLVQKSNRTFWNQPWAAIENSLAWHLSWFTPALVLTAVAYGGLAARRWWRTRCVEPLDFIWGLSLAIFLAYAFVSPSGSVYQGKYAFPAIPLMVFAVTAFLLAATRERPNQRSVAVALLAGPRRRRRDAGPAHQPGLLGNERQAQGHGRDRQRRRPLDRRARGRTCQAPARRGTDRLLRPIRRAEPGQLPGWHLTAVPDSRHGGVPGRDRLRQRQPGTRTDRLRLQGPRVLRRRTDNRGSDALVPGWR